MMVGGGWKTRGEPEGGSAAGGGASLLLGRGNRKKMQTVEARKKKVFPHLDPDDVGTKEGEEEVAYE